MGEGRETGEARWASANLACSWMGWSRSKIHLVHKKGGYGSPPFRHYCESLLVSIWACA